MTLMLQINTDLFGDLNKIRVNPLNPCHQCSNHQCSNHLCSNHLCSNHQCSNHQCSNQSSPDSLDMLCSKKSQSIPRSVGAGYAIRIFSLTSWKNKKNEKQ